MNCPKCTTNGKPTPLRRDIAIIGGGSSIERQSGFLNEETVAYWTCWSCGTLKELEIIPMPITPEMFKREYVSEATVEPKKLSPYDSIAQDAVMMFRDSIAKELKRGSSFETIAALLCKATGKKIVPKRLSNAWARFEKEAV